MTTKYIVIYTDFGNNYDIASILGVYTSNDKALEAILQDITNYENENPRCTIIDQQVPNWIEAGTESHRRLWQILEVEV